MGNSILRHVTMKWKMLFSIFCTKISIHLETLFDGFISIEVSFVVDVQSYLLYHSITTEGYWNTMARPLLRNFPFGNSIDNFIILFEAIIISFYVLQNTAYFYNSVAFDISGIMTRYLSFCGTLHMMYYLPK